MPLRQPVVLLKPGSRADRFHVIKNLGEALEGVLARPLAAHRSHVAEESKATSLSTVQAIQPPKLSPKEAQRKQAKREERLAHYQHVVILQKLGFSQTAIADQVGVAHARVSRWLAHDAFPEQRPRPRMIGLESHLSFLRERWEAGGHTIAGVVSGTGGPWVHPIVCIGV